MRVVSHNDIDMSSPYGNFGEDFIGLAGNLNLSGNVQIGQAILEIVGKVSRFRHILCPVMSG